MITGQSELQRQRYWQGQRLRSRDFNDQLAAEGELRWWHNRALHDPYGVVEGLQLMKFNQVTVVGWGDLDVTAGFAYDGFGRELQLKRTRTVAPPTFQTEQTWSLLLCYPASASLSCQRDEAELRWVEQEEVRALAGVRLAEGRYEGSTFQWNALAVTPHARPLARLRIGHGATVSGKTAWRAWELSPGEDSQLSWQGIEVNVDTSAFGFTVVPRYFARLVGGPLSVISQRRAVPAWLLERIIGARRDRFTFSLWAPHAAGFDKEVSVLDLARRQLSVAWLGVEPTATVSWAILALR